jgi:tetratricopeptide (TPR) repeat protein
MSFRNRVRLIAIIPVVLWLVVTVRFLPPERFGTVWMLLSAFLAVLLGMSLVNLVVRRYLNRFRVALAREDLATARRLLEGLSDFYRWRGREVITTYGINILLLEARFQEALDGLRALDVQKLGEKESTVVKSQIAWCTAQLGDPAKAADMIHAVLPQMETMGADYLASAHLALGVSNFLMGKAAEAVPHLETAYTSATARTSRKATAAFYLGESYSALSNPSEARRAYQNAIKALPNGRSGIRALERIS